MLHEICNIPSFMVFIIICSGHRGRQPWLFVSIKLLKDMYIKSYIVSMCQVNIYKYKIHYRELYVLRRLIDVFTFCGINMF